MVHAYNPTIGEAETCGPWEFIHQPTGMANWLAPSSEGGRLRIQGHLGLNSKFYAKLVT